MMIQHNAKQCMLFLKNHQVESFKSAPQWLKIDSKDVEKLIDKIIRMKSI